MNNWPKFLPHPASWAKGFALSSGFWLIVSVLLPGSYYYYYRFSIVYWPNISSSNFKGAIAFAWLCQIPLFAFYHWGLTKFAEWVEIRRHNQPPTVTVSPWLHWREGFIAFATLPAAIVMGIPAIAFLMLPLRDSAGSIIALILGSAIASAYLYHFRLARLLKIILKFLWIFYADLLKILQLLLVPTLTGTPFFVLTFVTAPMVPRQLLPLTTFLLVISVFLSGIVGYAALQYWSAHLVNWAAKWWPANSPGYSRIQARKAWKHNKTAATQSLVRHTTSWHLAANDTTYLIYFNGSAIVFGAIASVLFGEPSKWSETQEEMLGSAVALVWVAQWHFWGWGREVAIAGGEVSAKKTSRDPKLPAADPVEVELNQLAAEFGDARMRPVRKPSSLPKKPKSQQAQWYVFRSGKAEGPYTKDQLRDVQKITERTKVKLGQTEWQRAGEILELAAFLTQK
jgi:GYF domain 2